MLFKVFFYKSIKYDALEIEQVDILWLISIKCFR